MRFSVAALVVVATHLAGSVAAHAVVTSPTPRAIGSALTTACGSAVATKLKSDLTGPIENSQKVIGSDYNAAACHLYFCKGYQYSDNVANTRKYPAGTVVPFHVNLVAHHTGYANVSVVNLATQKTIGTPLINWPVYADSTVGPSKWPKNETDFNVTIPNLGTTCSTGGACAIQWWWYATENSQTYQSCVDFTQ